MIHPQTTFRHHLFQIAIAERIPEIPPHTQHDQFILEMSSSEYRWPVLSHSVYLTSRAPPFATLPDELTGDGAVMRYPYYDSFPEPGVRSVRVVRPWFARARSRFVGGEMSRKDIPALKRRIQSGELVGPLVFSPPGKFLMDRAARLLL